MHQQVICATLERVSSIFSTKFILFSSLWCGPPELAPAAAGLMIPAADCLPHTGPSATLRECGGGTPFGRAASAKLTRWQIRALYAP